MVRNNNNYPWNLIYFLSIVHKISGYLEMIKINKNEVGKHRFLILKIEFYVDESSQLVTRKINLIFDAQENIQVLL